MRNMRRSWLLAAGKHSACIFSLLAFCSPLAIPARSANGAETTATATSAAATVDKLQLDRLLAGATPTGVADLRAMQDHVRKLTNQLMKCTVGVQVGQAQGSGVVISKDGFVLTAAHVAGQPNRNVTFLMSDGRVLRGKTLGLNRTVDSGLMKIDGVRDLPFVEMGASDRVNEGQWCLATGHPGGYQSDRTPVLRLGRVLLTENTTITTDCTLVGGDSGGPLFDMEGRVIGINSRIAGPLQANMHVPVNSFRETWDRLSTGEAWGHFPGQDPYIGIKGDAASKEAKIAEIVPDSPGAKSGLQVGDIVLKIDDQDLPDFASLSAAVRDRQPGDRIKLQVRRGEEMKEIRLKLGRKG